MSTLFILKYASSQDLSLSKPMKAAEDVCMCDSSLAADFSLRTGPVASANVVHKLLIEIHETQEELCNTLSDAFPFLCKLGRAQFGIKKHLMPVGMPPLTNKMQNKHHIKC